MSFCRVAEFQRRGVVHLHAVIRADGVDGKLPPLTAEDLARAALSAAGAIAVVHPLGIAHWGSQVDVQLLDRSAGSGVQQVASYVAKYATKSSDGGGALDAPIRSEEDLACRSLPPQLRRMAETAWALWATTPRSSRSACAIMPTDSATAVISCPNPGTTRPASAPSKPPGSPGEKGSGGGDGNTAAADRSVERRLRRHRRRLGQSGGSPMGGFPAAATTRGAAARQRGVVQPDGAGYRARGSVVRRS